MKMLYVPFRRIINENTNMAYIFWSFLLFSSYAIIYEFRFLDRNIFFSWNDIFKGVGIDEIFLLIFACIVLSYVFSNLRFELNEKPKLLLLFSGAFLLGGVFWSAPETNPDMGRYFFEAKYLKEYGILTFIRDWGGELDVLSDFPAVPFIYGSIFKFAGESKIYVQIVTTAMFALTCVLTYLIGEKLWNRSIGIYAALFLLSFPYLLLKTSLTLVSVPLMFFLAVAIYSTLNALEAGRSKIWIFASVVFIVLTFLSKFSAWILLITVPTIFLINCIKKERVILYRSALIALLSGALAFTFIFYKMDVLVDMFEVVRAFRQRAFVFYESPWSLLLFQMNPLVALLAGFSLYTALKKKDMNYVLLLSWFLIPFIFFYNTRIRYMVPALPAIAIMASIALSEIKVEKSRKFLASSIILCSVAIAVFFYLPFTHTYSSMNIKNAAEYTNALNTGVEVYPIFPEDYPYNLNILIPFFDIYYEKTPATPRYGAVPKEHPDARQTWAWTWVYRDPPLYYPRQHSPENSIVIISPSIEQDLPEKLEKRLKEEYRLARVYSAGYVSSIYPYIVKVYVPKLEII